MVTNEITKSCEDWTLDTTCIFHTFLNRDWFSTYKNLSTRDVTVIKISTHNNLAGMLTKSLPITKFELCVNLVSIHQGD